jgi:hypothetical protein
MGGLSDSLFEPGLPSYGHLHFETIRAEGANVLTLLVLAAWIALTDFGPTLALRTIVSVAALDDRHISSPCRPNSRRKHCGLFICPT